MPPFEGFERWWEIPTSLGCISYMGFTPWIDSTTSLKNKSIDPIPNQFKSLPHQLWFQTDGHFTRFETRLMTETFDSNDTLLFSAGFTTFIAALLTIRTFWPNKSSSLFEHLSLRRLLTHCPIPTPTYTTETMDGEAHHLVISYATDRR